MPSSCVRSASRPFALVSCALLTATFLFLAPGAASSAPSRPGPYQYLSPTPGSNGVSPLNNVVIRDGRGIDPGSLAQTMLVVAGSSSGTHAGRLSLSDDGRTLVFNPDRPFAPGERVTVTLERGPRTRDAVTVPPVTFDFSVANAVPRAPRFVDEFDEPAASTPGQWTAPSTASADLPNQVQGDLPASFPPMSVKSVNNPDPGGIFFSPMPKGANRLLPGHLVILDNYGLPLFYRKQTARVMDFKVQPTGLLTFFHWGPTQYYAMDSTFAVVDSFQMGNGYIADSHDLLLMPNGHALMFAYDVQPVDMSTIVPGGNPEAYVTGLVIQELDAARNVVFQWRSWDHIAITDMTRCYSLTDSLIDYYHGNSVEPDHDGNLIVSGKTASEITKIDRQTGDIIWRFGPNAKHNQFAILDSLRGFSDQHDVRRLPNGHLLFYDNGFSGCLTGAYSRAVEYEMDETNMTAREVWSYRNTPDQYAANQGGVQRRANGATMICWGTPATNPLITDLHADGSKALEVWLGSPATTGSYRGMRFPWHTTRFGTDQDSLEFGTVALGDSALLPLTVTNHSAADLAITSFPASDSAFTVVEAVPLTIPAGGSVIVHAKFRPTRTADVTGVLHVRSATANDLIAYSVSVHGRGDTPTPVLLSLFDAGWTEGGVEVRWQFGATASFASMQVERSEGANGAWVVVSGEIREADGMMVMLDRGAVADHSYWYRVTATTSSGWVTTSESRAVPGSTPVGGFALAGVTPIPSRGRTQITFAVARPARVRLSVVDVQGRRVATLADGMTAAGRHSVEWKGARAGLYFVRYEWPGGSAVRRLVMTP